MTVRMSLDDGRTWPVSKTIDPGGSAYSCLAALRNQRIFLFYEKIQRKPVGDPTEDRGWMTLSLAQFTADWITG
jgi:sialidase-1